VNFDEWLNTKGLPNKRYETVLRFQFDNDFKIETYHLAEMFIQTGGVALPKGY
jgi:hypothetical protein